MKWKFLFLSLGLLFSVPSFAFADPMGSDYHGGHGIKEPCNCPQDKQHQHMLKRDWQAKMAEREQKLSGWVNQYTPDKKAEWEKVLQEKKSLHSQWMSPENAAKREKWKQEKMTYMKELKKQLEEGKITKEEFIKKAHGGKVIGHWKTFYNLEKAVETKNDKQAANLLNQLLSQYKQHNLMLKVMLKK